MDEKRRDQIKARLEAIRDKNGGTLRPDDVVADAKNKSSPLHDQFTWDDNEAAGQYRLMQARALIRSVRVEITTSTNRIVAPFYVRDPRVDANEQGYTAVAEIRDDAAVAMEALVEEFDRAIALLQRAVTLAEALGIADQVAMLLNQVQVIRQSVAPPIPPVPPKRPSKAASA